MSEEWMELQILVLELFEIYNQMNVLLVNLETLVQVHDEKWKTQLESPY